MSIKKGRNRKTSLEGEKNGPLKLWKSADALVDLSRFSVVQVHASCGSVSRAGPRLLPLSVVLCPVAGVCPFVCPSAVPAHS